MPSLPPSAKSSLGVLLPHPQGHERCGYVMPNGDVVEVANVHPEPTAAFDMRAEDILAHAETAVATWHTHPGLEDSSNLSVADWYFMLNFPDLRHFIVGRDGVAEYRCERGAVIHVR